MTEELNFLTDLYFDLNFIRHISITPHRNAGGHFEEAALPWIGVKFSI